MAEALTARGIEVTAVEQLPQVLGTLDAPLAVLVEDERTGRGVTVLSGTAVTHVATAMTGLEIIAGRPAGR